VITIVACPINLFNLVKMTTCFKIPSDFCDYNSCLFDESIKPVYKDRVSTSTTSFQPF